MKKIFALFMCVTSLLTAAQQTLEYSSSEIETIFQENYLNAEDITQTLHVIAGLVLQETNVPLSTDVLVEEFKKMANDPSIKENYLKIYASELTPEQIEQIDKLIKEGFYLKNRVALEKANWMCLQETRKMFKELAQTMQTYPLLPTSQESIIQVTKDNLQNILNSSPNIVLDVYTDWCGPCKRLAPAFQELNQECGHLYKFVKLNAEQEEYLTNHFHIQSFPTIIFIKNGKEVGRHLGFISKAKLLAKIQQHLD